MISYRNWVGRAEDCAPYLALRSRVEAAVKHPS